MNPGQLGGTLVDRYKLQEQLGKGAGGRVYKAFDSYQQETVAIKYVDGEESSLLRDLKREFRVLRTISHPNLIALKNMHATSGETFFSMELIEGGHLLDFLRGTNGLKLSSTEIEVRVRLALAQLSLALAEIHGKNLLHRDIKPGNVLVDSTLEEPRVVLVDFGLGKEASLNQGTSIAGTPGFIAPEVISELRYGEAADWYGVGATLWHCLTGRFNRFGESVDLEAHISPEIALLISGLTHPDPELRFGFDEVQRGLRLTKNPAPTSYDKPFVGRIEELKTLVDLSISRQWQPVIHLVDGAAGIGKTALFKTAMANGRQFDAIHLSVSSQFSGFARFGVLDLIVEELADQLQSMASQQRLEKLPYLQGATALRRLFPDLDSDKLFGVDDGFEEVAHVQDQRTHAFSALAEMLRRLTEDRPVTIWVDDAQWEDVGSASLLAELIMVDNPPPITYILATRDLKANFVSRLREVTGPEVCLGLTHLENLSEVEAKSLISSAKVSSDILGQVGGDPFLLAHSAEWLRPDKTLDESIVVQYQEFSLLAKDIIHTCITANRSVPKLVLVDALDAHQVSARASFEQNLQQLLQGNWLKERLARDDSYYEIGHPKLTEALSIHLATIDARPTHQRLAQAYLRVQPENVLVVIRHLEASGETAEAYTLACQAGEKAISVSAYESAVQYYATASEIDSRFASSVKFLRSYAKALELAGQREEAARTLKQAALLGGDNLVDISKLRAEAAALYMSAGRSADAKEILRDILDYLDVPKKLFSRAKALRFWFLLTNYRFRIRPDQDIDPCEVAKLEPLKQVAKNTSMVDHLMFDALELVHLNRVMKLGAKEFTHLCFALEASRLATIGKPLMRWADSLRERTSDLEMSQDAYTRAAYAQCCATIEYNQGEWAACVTSIEKARGIYLSECTGVAWELDTMDSYYFGALAQTGRIAQLLEQRRLRLAEAEARNDLYALAVYYTFDLVVGDLAEDNPALAHKRCAYVKEKFLSKEFVAQSYYYLTGMIKIALYEGEYEAARDLIDSSWPTLDKEGYLTLDCISVLLREMRVQALLGCLLSGSVQWNKQSEKLVRDEIKQMNKTGLEFAQLANLAIEAAIARLNEDTTTERRLLRHAIRELGRHQMITRRAALQLRLSVITDDVEGEASREEAFDALSEQGIKDPYAFSRLHTVAL